MSKQLHDSEEKNLLTFIMKKKRILLYKKYIKLKKQRHQKRLQKKKQNKFLPILHYKQNF